MGGARGGGDGGWLFAARPDMKGPGYGYPPQWVVRRITKGVADAGGVERRAAGGCNRAWEAVRGREPRLRGLGPGPRKGTSWGV